MNVWDEEQERLQAKRATRATFVTRLFIVVLVTMLVTSMAANTILVGLIRSTQLEGTPTGKKLVESSDRILDCTDPSGRCYRRNEQRTAAVVGDIGRYIVLAAACSANVETTIPVDERIATITDCVARRLTAKP